MTSAPVSVLKVTFLSFMNRSVFHTLLSSSDIVSRNAESVELSSSTTDKFLFLQTALSDLLLCSYGIFHLLQGI